MKNNIFISGMALMCLLNISPVLSQDRISAPKFDHPEKIRIPKDAPDEIKDIIDSLKRNIDAKYEKLLAPLEYEKDILSARKRFALDSLKAEEKKALAVLPDSLREEKEILKTRFKIQRENIRLQFAQSEDPIQDQIDSLKIQKQNEINDLILKYLPNTGTDSTYHKKPKYDKPNKDSLEIKTRNSIVTPNPSNGNGTITINKFRNDEPLTLSILDQQGNIKLSSTTDTGTFTFSGLSEGLYFYIVLDENGKKKSEGKILVQ